MQVQVFYCFSLDVLFRPAVSSMATSVYGNFKLPLTRIVAFSWGFWANDCKQNGLSVFTREGELVMVVKRYRSASHNLVLPCNDVQQKLLLLPSTINPYRNSLPSVYTASLQRFLLFNLRLFPCFRLLFVIQSIEIEMEPLNFTIKMHKSKQNS